MSFNIKKVRPLFTGVVTTARRYVGEQTTANGLILDTRKMEGSINPYQWVVSVGSMIHDLKEGDIVKINFKRYEKAKHTPGAFDEANNKTLDNLSVTCEVPMIVIDGQECLFIQNNDIEYVVTDYDGIEDGGLLQ